MPKTSAKVTKSTKANLERRESPRIFIKQKIHCKDAKEFQHLYITNLSKGGMFLKTPCPPPLGTLMRLGLRLPGTDHDIELNAKVVQSQPFGVGLQFLDLSPQVLQLMEEFIESKRQHAATKVTLAGNLISPMHCLNLDPHSEFYAPEVGLPILLRYLNQRSLSGILHLSRGNEFRKITISEGVPTEVTSSNFNENFCLGRMLKRAGSISNKDLAATMVAMEQSGKKQGVTLLEQGLLKWEEIQKGLEWQLLIRLDEVLSWDSGSYRFCSEEFGDQENWVEPEVNLNYALFRSCYRQAKNHPDDLTQAFCNYKNYEITPLEIKRQNRDQSLFQSYREISLWHHIVHRQCRIEQLCELDGVTEAQALAFVYALCAAGLILLKPSQSRSENYFERLKLPWTVASKEEITAAHNRALHLLGKNSNRTLKEKIDEAYQTLANDYQRRSYRKCLVKAHELARVAERCYRLGKIKYRGGKIKEAYPLLLTAADLNPTTPEYNEWLERAKKAA